MLSTNILSFLANLFVPPLLIRFSIPRPIFTYLAGLEFGLGLIITGMADPAKVLRFFAFAIDFERFDPSLAHVLLFAIVPSVTVYLWRKPGQVSSDGKRQSKPTLADRWSLPTASVADIDWRFIAGMIAFGIGWGLSGVCPGPAILRTVLQPAWGLIAMPSFLLGSMV